MRTIVGIDETKRHRATLSLLARLKLQGLELDLVNVVPLVESFASMYPAQVVINYDEMSGNLREEAGKILDDAVDDACERGLKASAQVMVGTKAEGISTAADDRDADLIAVASGPKGHLDRLLSGSLAQSLAIAAHQSLLIVRGPERKHGSLKAVFATDHSDYANRCLDQLLSWGPKGLAQVRVVTAYTVAGHESGVAGHHTAVQSTDVDSFIYNQIAARSEEVAQRFRDHGIDAEALTVRDEVNTVIHHAMHQADADLLILGARGHGFWDRLLMGSTAQHQVIAGSYPVLLLRIPSRELVSK